MELLAFSSTMDRCGDLLVENSTLVVSGRISVRDEKAPQLIVNQVWPIDRFSQTAPVRQPEQRQTVSRVYLRLPGESSREYRRTCPVLHMFPGRCRWCSTLPTQKSSARPTASPTPTSSPNSGRSSAPTMWFCGRNPICQCRIDAAL